MKNIIYKIDDNSLTNLKKLEFYHMGEGIYCHRFPVYKSGKYITLFGIFVANDENNEIHIDVFDENGSLYAPFYSKNKDNDVNKIIFSNIKKEMEKCNIKGYRKKELYCMFNPHLQRSN